MKAAIIADPEGGGFEFAKGIYDYILQKEERNFPLLMRHLSKTRFRDGESKLKISENVRQHACYLIHDPNKKPDEWVADLLFSLECLSSSSPAEIVVVFPYMRFARQDRKDESRVVVSSKAIVDVLSRYADRALAVDLHAAQIPEYGTIPFDNLHSFPVLIDHLINNHRDSLENLALVSPDVGGGKRVEAFAKALARKGFDAGIALGHKSRVKDNEVEKITIIGEVAGKDCLILDDMIDTGGTVVSAAEGLRERGARKVMAYGTHGLFSSGIEKFKVLDQVMTTDTLNLGSLDEIEVISVRKLFGEAIYRTIVGESLSDLFDV
jgi:ribose-phosphate pyrophosphokinase